VMNSLDLKLLYEAQETVMEMLALGGSRNQCLDQVCRSIEALIDPKGARSSILFLESGQLRHGAAPGLPSAYCRALDGTPIGPTVGSCGTACYLSEPVIVEDINTSPLWEDYRELAAEFDLRACWSHPILSSDRQVLGSFAVYYDQPRQPTRADLTCIGKFTHLTSLIIEKFLMEERENRLRQEVFQAQAKFQAFAQVLPDVALVLDDQGRYVDFFGAASPLLAMPPEEFLGKFLHQVLEPALAEQCYQTLQATLSSGTTQVLEYELALPDGVRTFEGRTSQIPGYRIPGQTSSERRQYLLWVARDISERKLAERRIRQLAYFDPLTRLPNRRNLQEHLERLLSEVIRHHKNGALLYLDLDDFKRINDSVGHSVGDQLLQEVAGRLQESVRSSETIARLGGDEFVIVSEPQAQTRSAAAEDAAAIAYRVLECFSQPFVIESSAYNVRPSIGISLIDPDTQSGGDILKRADTAMYNAKHRGGNCYSFFETSLQDLVTHRLELEQNLLDALSKRELQAHFQTQVSLDGQLLGMEALARWHSPGPGTVSPEYFVPVAERSGLIYRLQEIVLEDACDMLRRLKDGNLLTSGFRLAINISADQFKSGELKKSLMSVLDRHGQNPGYFTLEITESMLMQNKNDTIEQMQALRELGFAFSIDDFGTGYSSLAYLHRFPVDQLKVDKSFIAGMNESDAIVRTIVAMAKQLGFSLVAEGVEQQWQISKLRQLDVDALQGFYFSRPVSADTLLQQLQSIEDHQAGIIR